MMRNTRSGTFPIFFLMALLCLAPSVHAADPAPPAKQVSAKQVPTDLLGTWHTVSIDGDCLFLIIREVRLTLQANGRFIASVRFRDDSVKTMPGTFRLKPGHLLDFHDPAAGQDGLLQYKIYDKGNKLRLRDEKFSVTVDLTRMQAPGDGK